VDLFHSLKKGLSSIIFMLKDGFAYTSHDMITIFICQAVGACGERSDVKFGLLSSSMEPSRGKFGNTNLLEEGKMFIRLLIGVPVDG